MLELLLYSPIGLGLGNTSLVLRLVSVSTTGKQITSNSYSREARLKQSSSSPLSPDRTVVPCC